MSKIALISVSNKDGIIDFAKNLISLDYKIISTGGTYQLLKENNIDAIEVSEHTGFPEIMDGRIKTLHPKIHAGILSRRKIDKKIIKGNFLLFENLLYVKVKSCLFEIRMTN